MKALAIACAVAALVFAFLGVHGIATACSGPFGGWALLAGLTSTGLAVWFGWGGFILWRESGDDDSDPWEPPTIAGDL